MPNAFLIVTILSFIIIVTASNQAAKIFQKIKLPIITGFLLIGVLCGPYVLKLLSYEQINELGFINEISFAFIAFAVGSELFLSELRNRAKSIKWITTGQITLTFVLSSVGVYLVADYIPFIKSLNNDTKIAIALLTGIIFIARSPASTIAVINELRARGPFTQTALGVTIISDIIVIILFTICFAVADVLISDTSFNTLVIAILSAELILSFLLGIVLAFLIKFLFSLTIHLKFKAVILTLMGYSTYPLSKWLELLYTEHFEVRFHLEPLLICIVASFVVTNYFKNYKREFRKIIGDVMPFIYVIFFTFTGTKISIDILFNLWQVALLLFFIRVIAMGIGSFTGSVIGGDPTRFHRASWMPYITQAGIALGLTATVASRYIDWGQEFYTILVSVIVINEIIGPLLFKFSIIQLKEHRTRASAYNKNERNVIIFGLEPESITLARQLTEHEWEVKIVTQDKERAKQHYKNVKVEHLKDLTLESMKEVGVDKVETLVSILNDNESYQICDIAYRYFGTKDMIVLVKERENIERFNKLGALIVEPSTAMISLLEHLVRSPLATSLILGKEKDQGTIDIEIRNPNIYGMALRDLRLPPDVLVMANKQRGNLIISTGYTRLRKGDVLTLVGSVKSLEKIRLKLQG